MGNTHGERRADRQVEQPEHKNNTECPNVRAEILSPSQPITKNDTQVKIAGHSDLQLTKPPSTKAADEAILIDKATDNPEPRNREIKSREARNAEDPIQSLTKQ